MNAGPKQIIVSTENIHTNSLIRLQVLENIQDKNYSFKWIKDNNQMINDNQILSHLVKNKSGNKNQYQCTPLDYGSIIKGQILIQQNGRLEIIKQIKYGPVSVEPRLCQQIKKFQAIQKKTQINISLNKDIKAKGIIKICKDVPLINNQNKIKIVLESNELMFVIKMEQIVKKPIQNSFLKFFQKQQESLGISIYHQHQQFIQRLKKINIFKNINFIGFYLKISFTSRFQRDSFLFNLMKYLKIQLFSLKSNQFQKILEPNKIKINQPQIKENFNSIETQPIRQIDNDVFRLLQDDQEYDNFSFDLIEAENLLYSKQLGFAKHGKKQSDMKNSEKKSILLALKNSNQTVGQKYFKNYSTFQSNNHYKKQIAQNIPIQFGSQKQNKLQDIIADLKVQIKNLTKQNRRLSQQNKKLKDENMKFRFKQIKTNYFKTLTNYHSKDFKKRNSMYVQSFDSSKRQQPVYLKNKFEEFQSNKNQDYKGIKKFNSGHFLNIPQQKLNINSSGKTTQSSRSFMLGHNKNNFFKSKQFFLPYKRQPKIQKNNLRPISFRQNLVFKGINRHHHRSFTNPQANQNTHLQIKKTPNIIVDFLGCNKKSSTDSIQFKDDKICKQ